MTTQIAAMTPQREDLAEGVFVLHNALSPQECDRFIALSEARGYHDAPVTTHRGPVHRPDIRNNHRLMCDDPVTASALWSRIAQSVVRRQGWAPIGLNERLRFYRYSPGQRFALHRDGHYARSPFERSFLTLLFYLNDDFQGGETVFPASMTRATRHQLAPTDEMLSVKPSKGMALLFDHHMLHEGAAVTQGRKYVLRSDVMFQR